MTAKKKPILRVVLHTVGRNRRNGLRDIKPRDIQFIVDTTVLPNISNNKTIRDFDGRYQIVQAFIKKDVKYQKLLDTTLGLLKRALPVLGPMHCYVVQIAIESIAGKHRAIMFAQDLAAALENEYHEEIDVIIRHTHYRPPPVNKSELSRLI